MTLPQQYTTVYFGNSTVECAVNDLLLPSAYNFARSSETMDAVYTKLQLIKEYNPQVDTIVVGFDDIILLNNKLGGSERSHLYFVEKYDVEDWWMNLHEASFDNNSESVSHIYNITRTLPIIKSYFSQPNLKSLGIGGYLRLHRDKLDIDTAMRTKNPSKRIARSVEVFPIISHYYLDKIVNYCRDKDIKLFLLNTPKHNYVWADTVYRDIHRAYYSEIPLIDCLEIAFPDSCYGDCIHLNYRGADAFTSMISGQFYNTNSH